MPRGASSTQLPCVRVAQDTEHTRLYGSTEHRMGLMELTVLVMSDTAITGSTEDLKDLEGLTKLDTDNTAITG